MRRQTRPYCGVSVVVSPFQNLGQTVPVWLILQIRRPGLAPRNNQAVDLAGPEVLKSEIETLHPMAAPIVPGNVRQGIKREPHQDAVGSRIKKCQELALRCFERSVGHVVDQADVDAGTTPSAIAVRLPAKARRAEPEVVILRVCL